jgi:predicted dehydrogenase
VGVGHLGKHHARLLAAIDGARLTAVVDIDAGRAAAAAEATGARAMTDYRDLVGQVDAQALIAAAQASGATFAVGHTERHNPAVAVVMPFVSTPRFIEVHRLGVFPDRSLDIDVVFDLMIHDLDIILALVKSDVTAIEAVGVPVLTDKYDIANARLRFQTGCIANVTASRISKERVRKIRFFQPDAYMSIDYAEQEVEGYRLVRRDGERPAIQGGKLPVTREEPLKRELEDFVRAVREQRPPLVTGEDGLRALKLARAIAEKMESL